MAREMNVPAAGVVESRVVGTLVAVTISLGTEDVEVTTSVVMEVVAARKNNTIKKHVSTSRRFVVTRALEREAKTYE